MPRPSGVGLQLTYRTEALTPLGGSWFCPHISPSEAPNPLTPVRTRWLGGAGHHWVGVLLAKVPRGLFSKRLPILFQKTLPLCQETPWERLQSFQSLDFWTWVSQGYSGWVCDRLVQKAK